MRNKNRKKAVRLCNEFLTELDKAYSREDKAYLYIWSWVDVGGVYDILSNMIERNKYYNPRIDWERKIRETDEHIHCVRIDEKIKDDALRILTPFFEKWEEIKNCFE